MIPKLNIINKEHYNSIVYLSHPYGGKQENLSKINECQKLLTIMHPENLYLNPSAMLATFTIVPLMSKGWTWPCCYLKNLQMKWLFVQRIGNPLKAVARRLNIVTTDIYRIKFVLWSKLEMNTKNTERNMIKMGNFIIGALVGLVLGFLIAYRTVTEMLNELDENDKEENANGSEINGK